MGKAFGKGKQSAFSRANEVKVAGQTLIICRDFEFTPLNFLKQKG